MTRIAGVSRRDAGPTVKLAYWFTRRHMARLAGRETEQMIEPVTMYAHVPGVLRAYGMLEQATAKLKRLDERYRALAELKAATVTQCEYCIDWVHRSRDAGGSVTKNCSRCRRIGRAHCSPTSTSWCSTMRSA